MEPVIAVAAVVVLEPFLEQDAIALSALVGTKIKSCYSRTPYACVEATYLGC